jgi:transcriptional regulator of nitric oxide reductase
MRIVIVVLALLLTTVQANGKVFGKKKSKNADPRDAQIDSLTTLTKTLTLQLDSVSEELSKYAVAPDSLKVPGDTSAVLPATVPQLPAPSESVTMAAVSAPAPVPLIVEPKGPAAPDSVAVLLEENKMLTATVDSMKVVWVKTVEMLTSEEVVKATAVSDLKNLKELLDAGILTVAEFTLLKKKYLEKL